MRAKSYRVGAGPRMVNRLYMALVRRARGPGTLHVLTTTGRRSGAPCDVPVRVIDDHGEHWLVAVYGVHGWVWNARSRPVVRLRRGGQVRLAELREVEPERGASVLQRYVEQVPHVRAYLDLDEDATPSEYRKIAGDHPVFHVQWATRAGAA